MIKKVFSILDVKADLYSNPWYMAATGEAVRAFKDLVNDKNTLPGRHPGDFKLVQLAAWDDQGGKFVNLDPVINLGMGDEYVTLKPNEVPIGLKAVPKE